MSAPCYISASRRTDIPAFFADAFFAAWRAGGIAYDAGYGRSYTTSLRREDVLGFVFWSKDFAPFVNHRDFGELIAASNAVFHFTINDCPELEPHVPALGGRLATLAALCERVGPQRVVWRFDPIVKYVATGGRAVTNAAAFFDILPHVARAGVTRCYFSFMSHYPKLARRGVDFGDFDPAERTAICRSMLAAAGDAGVTLYNCCNEDIPRLVPRIGQAHCIDDELLRATDRFGVHPGLRLKPTRQGCGCYQSRDVGSYDRPCAHGCRYCYARPALEGDR